MTERFIKFTEWTLVAILTFTVLTQAAVGLWALSVTESALLILAALFFVFSVKQGEFKIRKSGLFTLILAFLALCGFQLIPMSLDWLDKFSPTASYFYSKYLSSAGMAEGLRTVSLYVFGTKSAILKLVSIGLVFFLVIHIFRGYKSLRSLVYKLIILVGIVAAVGTFYRIFELLHVRNWFYAFVKGGGEFGFFVNINNFSNILAVTLPLSLGFILEERERRRDPVRETTDAQEMKSASLVPLYATVFFMLAGIFVAGSRGGYVTCFFGLVFFFLFVRFGKGKKGITREALTKIALGFMAVFFAVAVGLIVIWLKTDAVANFIRQVADREDLPWIVENVYQFLFPYNVRWYIWEDNFQMFRAFAWLGVGLGNFVHIFPAFKQHPSYAKYTHIENEYFQLLSETGLVGLLLFAAMVFIFFRYVLKGESRHFKLMIGALSGTAAFLLHSIFDFNMHIPANALVFCVISGIAFSLKSSGGGMSANEENFRVLRAESKAKKIGLAAVAVVITLLLLGWIWRNWAAESHYRLGEAHEKRGALVSAVTEYGKATDINPGNFEYFYSLAFESLKIAVKTTEGGAFFPIAEKAARRAIDLQPASGKAHLLLARIYVVLGRKEMVLREFKFATELDWTNPLAHLFHARYLAKNDRTADALIEYDLARKLMPPKMWAENVAEHDRVFLEKIDRYRKKNKIEAADYAERFNY